MNWRNTKVRYGALPIGLHWLMLLLIAAVYTCEELSGFFPKGSAARLLLSDWHSMLGLLVFCFVWLRLAARLSGPSPGIEPEPASWQNLLARLTHIAFYVFMIGMPLIGWLLLSAKGQSIPFFGLQLPALMGQNKYLGGLIKEIHEAVGTAGYFLIGLHAAAALYHHYILGDNTFRRMLPRRD
jgi:superoxide oxidase